MAAAMAITQGRGMLTNTEALLRLQSWLSPAFPTGAFSYSHGLETAIADGLVTDADGLEAWLSGILRYGAGRSDAWLLTDTFEAVRERSSNRLMEAAELGMALSGAAELSLEARSQGMAFFATVRAVWPAPGLDWATDTLMRAELPATLPVATGIAGAAHGIPMDALVALYLNAFAANLVSAGVRLIPLGQTDGQRVTAALEPVVAEAATRSLEREEPEPANATVMVDICAMLHETQYTRLFRS